MAQRTTRRRRRAERQPTARTLFSQVSQLVTENHALARENKELHSILDSVGRAVGRLTSVRGRSNGQSRQGAAPARGRRSRGRGRTRRAITDPAQLERRRAALARAREALALKRAAAKRG